MTSAAVPPPRLYLITDRTATAGRPLLDVVAKVLGGLPPSEAPHVAIQLREKDLPGGALFDLAVSLRALTSDVGARLFINDRIDVALAAHADGVHLGQGSLSPSLVSGLVPSLAVAASTHTPDEVRLAAEAGVSFVVFGPVYDPLSKRSERAPVGIGALRDACMLGVPVLALGGVTPPRAVDCMAAGARGAASIGAIWGADDPLNMAAMFLRCFK